MLPSTSPSGVLLACPPFSLWSLPSFTVESTLSSSCSHSDPPSLSRPLDFIPPHDLIFWTDGSATFLLGKSGSGVLANCSLFVALRPLFPFQQAQHVPSFSAEVFTIRHALCWFRQHQQACHFSSILLLS